VVAGGTTPAGVAGRLPLTREPRYARLPTLYLPIVAERARSRNCQLVRDLRYHHPPIAI